MPRKKKSRRGVRGLPWYWAARDYWVTPGDRKNSPLRDAHGDLIRGKENEDKARRRWFDVMALTNLGRAGAEAPVKSVLEAYLADAEKRVTAKTHAL
jgi:hypothetical protein